MPPSCPSPFSILYAPSLRPSRTSHLHIHLRPRPYSTLPSTLLKSTTLPAPHTGHIRVLTLNSYHNRNALSKQLLTELSAEINTIKCEVDEEWTRFTAAQRRGNHHIDHEGTAGERRVGQGTRALIIGSELDSCFCAGADLKERRGMTAAEYVPHQPKSRPSGKTQHSS